jgi:neutral ceramidase
VSGQLLAGIGKREITPPVGKLMGAFPDRVPVMKARVAQGVHDPLWARALALSDGANTVAICIADVLGLAWNDVQDTRRRFTELTGLPGERLVIGGTHNHNGPECAYVFGGSPDDPYISDLQRGMAEAAAEAVGCLAPASIGAASVDRDLAYNRRDISPTGAFRQANANPTHQARGPVDPRVSVLRIDHADGRPLAAVAHFAAHPVIQTNPNRLFTAEYPGVVRTRLEALASVPMAIFWQGAAGDTHPYEALTNDWANVERMGCAVAEAAAEAYALCEPLENPRLAVQRLVLEAPHRYVEGFMVRAEVTAVRLSERLALVFWPGDTFVELSLALQWRSPFARTIVMGYSAGRVGYVAPRSAYEFGGYGVELYTIDPPEASRTSVRPGFGEQLVDETAQLLERLKNQA